MGSSVAVDDQRWDELDQRLPNPKVVAGANGTQRLRGIQRDRVHFSAWNGTY
jgi:hypothetical protein